MCDGCEHTAETHEFKCDNGIIMELCDYCTKLLKSLNEELAKLGL